jgi:DNA-directed RNA polymerase subunit RPC12/RpoP
MNEIYKCAICRRVFTEHTEGYFASKSINQEKAVFVCLDCAHADIEDIEHLKERKPKKNG